MQATRLPGKPMVDIGGAPMIVHVWRRAVAANAGRVVVATDATEVVAAIEAAGGEAVMTRADHASGSDRIFEAVTRIDPDARADIVINLQGDLPTLEPQLVAACAAPLSEPGTDIATLAAEITEAEERTNPNVVKVVGSPLPGSLRARPPARPLFHARHRSLGRGTAVPPHRHLRLPARGAAALRVAATFTARIA